MAAFSAATLMNASLCNFCQPIRAAPRKTLGSGLPDRMMAVLRCRFSLGSIVCGPTLKDRGRRGVSSSCIELRWRCQVMPGPQVLHCSCLVGRCYARQILQNLRVWMDERRAVAPLWHRWMDGLARMMWISLLKMGQQSDDDGGL